MDSGTLHLFGIVAVILVNRLFPALPQLARNRVAYLIWQVGNIGAIGYLTWRVAALPTALPGFSQELGRGLAVFLSLLLAYHVVVNWQTHGSAVTRYRRQLTAQRMEEARKAAARDPED